MFGFGKTKEEVIKEQKMNEDFSIESRTQGGMHSLWGTSDPKKINRQMRKYMPELMGTIRETKETAKHIDEYVIQMADNEIAIAKEVLSAIEDLQKQNEDEKRKNKELQEKYNALVERMAGYIERENGKGR